MAAALCVLSVLTARAAPFATSDPAPDGPLAPYVVTFDAQAQPGDQQAAEEDVVDAGGELIEDYSRVMRGFAAKLPAAAVAQLRSDPDVHSVTPDLVIEVAGGAQQPAPWNLDRIDQRSTTLNNTFSYDGDGAGITVYVVDTGIRADHVEFNGRVGRGYTALNDGNGTNDCDGHGTHVAGTIGASTYGVAKAVTLVPVRVLGCDGTGSATDVLAGLDWVLEHHVPGRSVVNLSLGTSAASFLDEAVKNVIAAGIPVVVAAGNSRADACAFSPARVPQAITVGAVDSADSRPAFSNSGPCLDVFAPGVNIVSPDSSGPTALASSSGTSSAAPHVAGAIAVLLQGAPGAAPNVLRAALGSLFTMDALSNIGTGSPNTMLYAAPRLRLAGAGTSTTGTFFSAASNDLPASASGALSQFDAFSTIGSARIITQDPGIRPGCTMSRPTSQAASRAALIASLLTGSGCLHFAQAEALDLTPAIPQLAYVPYAQENVTFAVTNVSSISKNLTLNELRAIYRCEGESALRPMLPRSGSGLREFWVELMYGGDMPTPKPACLQDGIDEFGFPIEANTGFQVNNREIVPFSVPQWSGQAAGVQDADLRGNTRIARVEGSSPFATGFPIERTLYVVFAASAVSGTAYDDLRLRSVFIGGGSPICRAVAGPIGLRYGFRPHPECGSSALRTP